MPYLGIYLSMFLRSIGNGSGERGVGLRAVGAGKQPGAGDASLDGPFRHHAHR